MLLGSTSSALVCSETTSSSISTQNDTVKSAVSEPKADDSPRIFALHKYVKDNVAAGLCCVANSSTNHATELFIRCALTELEI